MQQFSPDEYRALLTEVIRKQIAILGKDIALSKARGVTGLSVDDTGNITQIDGEPQVIMQALIDQFVQLSGLIVKKTMESLYAYHPMSQPEQQPKPAPSQNPTLQTPPIISPTSQTLDTTLSKAPQLIQSSTTHEDEAQRIINEALKT